MYKTSVQNVRSSNQRTLRIKRIAAKKAHSEARGRDSIRETPLQSYIYYLIDLRYYTTRSTSYWVNSMLIRIFNFRSFRLLCGWKPKKFETKTRKFRFHFELIHESINFDCDIDMVSSFLFVCTEILKLWKSACEFPGLLCVISAVNQTKNSSITNSEDYRWKIVFENASQRENKRLRKLNKNKHQLNS